jgi:UDP-N-acetylglucosamine:LPS N-acetylglucosamine transferase
MSSFKRIKEIRKNIKMINPDEIICFLAHPSVFVFIATLFTKYNKRISFAVRAMKADRR